MSSFIASRDYIKGNFFISTILQESFTVVNEITIRFFYSNFQNRKSKTLVAKSFKGIFFLKFFHFYV